AGGEIGGAGGWVDLGQANIRRHRPGRTELLGDDRAVGRPLIVRLQVRIEARLREVTGKDVVISRAVVRVVVAERTDQRKLVHLAGGPPREPANLDAPRGRRTRPQLAPNG